MAQRQSDWAKRIAWLIVFLLAILMGSLILWGILTVWRVMF